MHDLVRQFISERKRQKLSQEKVVDNCDVSQGGLSKIETGARDPSLNTFTEMLRGIGFMLIMAPIPEKIRPKIVIKEVEVEVEKKTDYDNWNYANPEEK